MSEPKQTKREPLIVRVPTALTLVHNQVRLERKHEKKLEGPPSSHRPDRATG